MTIQTMDSASQPFQPWIGQLMTAEIQARRLCRRKGVFESDADDFVSWSRLRVMDNDFAILRKFRGDCPVESFLAAVVANLYRDFQNRRFGKWRPSAAAKRSGEPALSLEAAIYRDGMGLRSAVRQLNFRGHPSLSVCEAAEILATLPQRERRTFVGDAPLVAVAADDRADQRLQDSERAEQLARATRALATAMNELDAEDRKIIDLRFRVGLSVADVARAMGLPQKPLYRRIPRILASLRQSRPLSGLELADFVH